MAEPSENLENLLYVFIKNSSYSWFMTSIPGFLLTVEGVGGHVLLQNLPTVLQRKRPNSQHKDCSRGTESRDKRQRLEIKRRRGREQRRGEKRDKGES